MFVTKWWGLAYDFAETYHMLFEGYAISFVRQTFRLMKEWVIKDGKIVEPEELKIDIRDLEIPQELENRRDEILRAIEEGMTTLSDDSIITINKIS